jgi:diguanylate cyclase (GGDEF)-like protein
MVGELITRKHVLRRTAAHVALAVGSTVVFGSLTAVLLFGSDPDQKVSVGFVMISTLAIGIVASALLAGGMSYRSSITLQQLTLARAELLRLSRTDHLTGLLNRRGFNEAAGLALAQANAGNRPAAAFMCDIDRFKTINDRFGHEFGDAVLVRIGEVLERFGREHDVLVARYGGEEFVGLIVGATAARASRLAERLRESCASQVISRDGYATHVTVSIGLTVASVTTTLPQIMRCADRALYTAKQEGRNRVALDEIAADPFAALIPRGMPAGEEAGLAKDRDGARSGYSLV